MSIMNTEYITDLIIFESNSINNSLLYLRNKFSDLNVIQGCNIQYNIQEINNNNNYITIQLKNYNLGEIQMLKEVLNSNGYQVNIMTLSSTKHLYIDIVNNSCLQLDHNLLALTNNRFSNCVKMASYFNFDNIHKQLSEMYEEIFSMVDDDMSNIFGNMNMMCSMDVEEI